MHMRSRTLAIAAIALAIGCGGEQRAGGTVAETTPATGQTAPVAERPVPTERRVAAGEVPVPATPTAEHALAAGDVPHPPRDVPGTHVRPPPGAPGQPLTQEEQALEQERLEEPPLEQPPEEAQRLASDVCPVGIPGLEVEVVDAQQGAALVFRADRAHLRELRERIERFAELHRETRRAHTQVGAPHTTFGDEDAYIHEAAVRAVRDADGVRLIARAARSEDIDALRDELRDDARAFERGQCPLAFEVAT